MTDIRGARIQRKREAGWKMPDNAVCITRPGKYGNPFVVGKTIGCDDRETAVALHKGWLELGHTAPYPRPGESEHLSALRDQILGDALSELAGRDLACWCHEGESCHGDNLIAYVEYMHRVAVGGGS